VDDSEIRAQWVDIVLKAKLLDYLEQKNETKKLLRLLREFKEQKLTDDLIASLVDIREKHEVKKAFRALDKNNNFMKGLRLLRETVHKNVQQVK